MVRLVNVRVSTEAKVSVLERAQTKSQPEGGQSNG